MKFEFRKYSNHIYFAFVAVCSMYLMINSYADKDPFKFFDKKSNTYDLPDPIFPAIAICIISLNLK